MEHSYWELLRLIPAMLAVQQAQPISVILYCMATNGGASDWGDRGLRQYRISGSRGSGGTATVGNLCFMMPQASLDWRSNHSYLTIIMEKKRQNWPILLRILGRECFISVFRFYWKKYGLVLYQLGGGGGVSGLRGALTLPLSLFPPLMATSLSCYY